jgi:uncharacterized membrane protein (UPF0127 family)
VKYGQRYIDQIYFRSSRGVHACYPGVQDEKAGTQIIESRLQQDRWSRKIMFRKDRHVFVYNKTKETFLAFRVRVADSIMGRLIGLLGKRSLKPDSGVWIVPSNAIHTIGMLFTFDAVMIDKDFKVVGLRELVRPFRILWPNFRAESVIELPAHTIFRSRTEVGDQFVIERYEAKKAQRPDSADASVQVAQETT